MDALQAAGANLADIAVLVLVWPELAGASKPRETHFALWQREGVPERVFFHVVVEHAGAVYDPLAKFQGLPLDRYLRTMMTADVSEGDLPTRGARAQREHRAMVRCSLVDATRGELRVHRLAADRFQSVVDPRITASTRPSLRRLFWHPLDPDRASSLTQIPGLSGPPSAHVVDAEVTERFGEVSVSYDRHWLEKSELEHCQGTILIARNGDASSTHRSGRAYDRYDHSLAELQKAYGSAMLDVDALRRDGSLVLDVGAGSGLFVEELREAGVLAFGMDVALTGSQRAKLVADQRSVSGLVELPRQLDSPCFLLGDAAQPFVAYGQVDVIYDTDAILKEEVADEAPTFDDAYGRYRRMLKPDGRIYAGFVDADQEQRIRERVARVGGLEVAAVRHCEGSRGQIALEIRPSKT